MHGTGAHTAAADRGQAELLQVLTEPQAHYQCPGETLPITAAVHQARLRAHYQKCRNCPHRDDGNWFSERTKQQLVESWNEKSQAAVTSDDGFRGVQWNQLTARDIERWCVMFCRQMHQRVRPHVQSVVGAQGPSAPTNSSQNDAPSAPKTRPRITLVMGHDSRISSLETLRSAMAAVTAQGVRVIDVGEVNGPCLQFAIDHLDADGGIHAGAAGASATTVGIDFYHRGGLPQSGESLHALQSDRTGQTFSRCSRSAGGIEPFPARKAYLAALWKSFRDLPERRIQIISESDFTRQTLRDLQAELCTTWRLISSAAPCDHSRNTIQQKLSSIINQQSLGAAESNAVSEFDLTVYLGEDGQSLAVAVAGQGVLSELDVIEKILKHSATESTRPTVLLAEEFQAELTTATARLRTPLNLRFRQSLREHFARGMRSSQAVIGVDRLSRYWLPGSRPVCDSLMTLGRLLQNLD